MSTSQRLDRLRAALEAHHLDGLLVSQPESRFYLSGYAGHDLPPRDSAGYLLISAESGSESEKALLLTDPRTTEQAEQESPEYEVVTYGAGSRGPQAIAAAAGKLGLRRLGFESIHLPYRIWDDVRKALPASVQLEPVDGLIDELRIIKDAEELASLQAAIDVLDRCLADVLNRLEPGLTERQVARMVELYLIEHADGPSFPSIVASGRNGSVPHAVPSERQIQPGEMITIDIGARSGWYCSDMTRTVSLGPPTESRAADLHAIVLDAQLHAERNLKPGMTAREADSLARDVIVKAGYGQAFTHSLGHGIGLEVHEPPWISQSRGDEVLRPGMVFSVEPGIYLAGWGGVRIEDLVVLEDSGARVLCRSPKELVLETSTSPRYSVLAGGNS